MILLTFTQSHAMNLESRVPSGVHPPGCLRSLVVLSIAAGSVWPYIEKTSQSFVASFCTLFIRLFAHPTRLLLLCASVRPLIHSFLIFATRSLESGELDFAIYQIIRPTRRCF
jgi:hypothetical protein